MGQVLLCPSRNPRFGELHALRGGFLGPAYEDLSVDFPCVSSFCLHVLVGKGRYDCAPFSKNLKFRGWRGGSVVKEHRLFFQRSRAQFPAPT